MNNIFDFKRFGNYFLYDLRRSKNNYGLSLLLLGLMPAIVFVFYEIIALLIRQELQPMESPMVFGAVAVAYTVVIFGAGAKIYGNLTEKRQGSDFLMLPASSLEKWLSMVLIVCIVVPVILFALTFVSDALMSFLFPNLYGDRMVARLGEMYPFDISSNEDISVNLPAILFLNWCESVLIFTLGAVCFKKGKVAKTFLCCFAFGILLSFVLALLAGRNFTLIINEETLKSSFGDPDRLVRFVNWFLNVIYAVVIGGLLGGLYYRIRTMKH